eukprot:scaffold325411_cov18-Prasinocladus_malaysianus.AAC.1
MGGIYQTTFLQPPPHVSYTLLNVQCLRGAKSKAQLRFIKPNLALQDSLLCKCTTQQLGRGN